MVEEAESEPFEDVMFGEFPVLQQYVTEGLGAHMEIAKFLKKVGDMCTRFSKDLSILCKTTEQTLKRSACGPREYSSGHKASLAILSSMEGLAEAHERLAQDVVNNAAVPLGNVLGERDFVQKELRVEEEASRKVFEQSRNTELRMRQTFFITSRDAYSLGVRSNFEQGDGRVEKAASSKASALEKDKESYRETVVIYNEARARYMGECWPNVARECERTEAIRYEAVASTCDVLGDAMKTFASAMQDLAGPEHLGGIRPLLYWKNDAGVFTKAYQNTTAARPEVASVLAWTSGTHEVLMAKAKQPLTPLVREGRRTGNEKPGETPEACAYYNSILEAMMGEGGLPLQDITVNEVTYRDVCSGDQVKSWLQGHLVARGDDTDVMQVAGELVFGGRLLNVILNVMEFDDDASALYYPRPVVLSPPALEMRGWLLKMRSALKRRKHRRWFRLRGQILSYYSSDEPNEPCKGCVFLNEFQLQEMKSRKQFPFLICTRARNYSLFSEGAGERDTWLDVLGQKQVQTAEYAPEVQGTIKVRANTITISPKTKMWEVPEFEFLDPEVKIKRLETELSTLQEKCTKQEAISDMLLSAGGQEGEVMQAQSDINEMKRDMHAIEALLSTMQIPVGGPDEGGEASESEGEPESGTLHRARAMYAYEARADTELDLTEGMILVVTETTLDSAGWWAGYVEGGDTTPKCFPESYVQTL